MKREFIEYGMLITAASSRDTYLFLDNTDRERYINTFIKMIERKSSSEAVPLIAGLSGTAAKILFSGGDEDYLRSVLQATHTSYATYRRMKKCPLHFGRSVFEVIEGKICMAEELCRIRKQSDYICTVFNKAEEDVMQAGTLIQRVNISSEKLTDSKLLYIAKRYSKVSSIDEFICKAKPEQKTAFVYELKNLYGLSYRKISEILKCSHTTVYRIVNRLQ